MKTFYLILSCLAASLCTFFTAGANDPVFLNLHGDALSWPGQGKTAALDQLAAAAVSDPELDALNGGLGDYAGTVLTVQRSGGAMTNDNFSLALGNTTLSLSAGSLRSNGQTFATVNGSAGMLTISFNSSQAIASRALVSQLLHCILYRNDYPFGDTKIQFMLKKGNQQGLAEVTVNCNFIYVTTASDTQVLDPSDGVCFSEAARLAASGSRNNYTIAFASSIGSSAIQLSGDVLLTKTLILFADGLAAPTLNGGTIILSAGSSTFIQKDGGTLTINSVLSGPGQLIKIGDGTVVLGGTNTATGTLQLGSGTLSVASSANLTQGRLVFGGGTLSVSGNTTLPHAMELQANAVIHTNANVMLSGVLSSTGGLTKKGTGTLALSAENTASGMLTISEGTLSAGGASNLPFGKIVLEAGRLEFTKASAITNAIELKGMAMVYHYMDLELAGDITGTGHLHLMGSGTAILGGNNNFGSLSMVGMVSVAGKRNLPLGDIAINSGSTLYITQSGDIGNPITLVGGSPTIHTASEVTLSGTIGQGSNFTGLGKTGSGQLILSGNCNYTGSTSLLGGSLVVNGSLSTRGMTVASGTMLSGKGSLFPNGSSGTLSIANGGTLAPGFPSGRLSVNGNLDMSAGSTLSIDIKGKQSDSYGQLSVSGNVVVNNVILNARHSYTAANLDSYLIIEKLGNGLVSGNFSGLPESTTFNATGNNLLLKLSYRGGSGNDVVLTAPEAVLPVKLHSFVAKAEGSAVRLDWKILSERDTRSFAIRRSKDGKDFKNVATVPSKGNSHTLISYQSHDPSPLLGRNYYQLVQTDLDGKQEELGVQIVDFSLQGSEVLVIVPNPAGSHTMVSHPMGTTHLELVDLNGRTLKTIRTSMISDRQRIELDRLPKATYLLKAYGIYGFLSAKILKSDTK